MYLNIHIYVYIYTYVLCIYVSKNGNALPSAAMIFR